jgi:hypothetical protein
MKTKPRDEKDGHVVRRTLRSRRRAHDPMLVFNMSIFNFTDGWRRTFSKYEYARFYA